MQKNGQFSLTEKGVRGFQGYIFSWWDKNKRDLPWRRTSDPYRILVSEVMLQQTQVSRVLSRYLYFLEAFPSVGSLSRAKTGEVLKAWKGLGYNRRALHLKQSSEIIVRTYGGYVPDTEDRLAELPGLGKYTVRAILVFAFRKDTYMIDTNIRKTLTFLFFNNIRQKESVIEEAAQKILPAGRSWEWHHALMDYGSLKLSEIMPRTKTGGGGIPFRKTKRFYRGRIIDYLRQNKRYGKSALVASLIKAYGVPEFDLLSVLDDLKKEGLIKESGSSNISFP